MFFSTSKEVTGDEAWSQAVNRAWLIGQNCISTKKKNPGNSNKIERPGFDQKMLGGERHLTCVKVETDGQLAAQGSSDNKLCLLRNPAWRTKLCYLRHAWRGSLCGKRLEVWWGDS